MSYLQIFKEIYCKNRKLILAYVTFCLVFSVFAFGNSRLAMADGNGNAAGMAASLGGSMMPVVLPMVQGFFGSMDVSSAMFLLCLISAVFDFVPEEGFASLGSIMGIEGLENMQDYSFGLFEVNAFRILCLAWFAMAKLSKSNRVTYTAGLILEDYESKIGIFVQGLAAASQYLSNLPLANSVQAAYTENPIMPSAQTVARQGSYALVCFFALIGILVMYLFIRYLFYCMDILLLPFCTFVFGLPFLVEVLKILCIVVLAYLVIACPYLFGAIFLMVLFVAVKLFQTSYLTVRYFKNIYAKPFFRKLKGYDKDILLVDPKAPKRVRQYAGEAMDIILPVYLKKTLPGEKQMHWHDRWWLVSGQGRQYLCKPRFLRDGCYSIELHQSAGRKIFLKKSLQFFEIFDLEGSEEEIVRNFRKIHTRLHVVFSKEYYYQFEKIRELAQFVDYALYSEQKKQSVKLERIQMKQQKREEKRQARLAEKEEKRQAKLVAKEEKRMAGRKKKNFL